VTIVMKCMLAKAHAMGSEVVSETNVIFTEARAAAKCRSAAGVQSLTKPSGMRDTADMRAPAKAHMSAAAKATAARLGCADGQGRGKHCCCQNHYCSFHGTLLSGRMLGSPCSPPVRPAVAKSCDERKIGATGDNPTKFTFRKDEPPIRKAIWPIVVTAIGKDRTEHSSPSRLFNAEEADRGARSAETLQVSEATRARLARDIVACPRRRRKSTDARRWNADAASLKDGLARCERIGFHGELSSERVAFACHGRSTEHGDCD
jgi:hypothetical protein